jgi:hypothetical protein
MEASQLLKSVSQLFVSSHILKSPYQEVYHRLWNQNKEDAHSFLILNQGVHIPFEPYYSTILEKEYFITYVDENPLSMNAFNQELFRYIQQNKEKTNISLIETQFEKVQSHFFDFIHIRTKKIKYDHILIHHYNYYMPQYQKFFQIIDSITDSGAYIILFASLSTDSSRIYKNKIRTYLSSYTQLHVGDLYSLEDILLSIPQEKFHIQNVSPYRESHYIGYGKNMIYRFTLQKK